jgi:dTDP-4-dehydrorhamnose 3,5-epimerase
VKRIETSLPGVCILEPRVFEDERGFFFESYHREKLAAFGITEEWVQDNHAHSVRGTLRGLHYQLRHPQAKICRVASGEVLDISVDIRRGSLTFGQWTGVVLSAENHRQLYIPRGFAHGYLVLSERADFLYKCDNFYAPDDNFGVAWNDPAIGIDWQLTAEPVLSHKDRIARPLSEVDPEQLPRYDQ